MQILTRGSAAPRNAETFHHYHPRRPLYCPTSHTIPSSPPQHRSCILGTPSRRRRRCPSSHFQTIPISIFLVSLLLRRSNITIRRLDSSVDSVTLDWRPSSVIVAFAGSRCSEAVAIPIGLHSPRSPSSSRTEDEAELAERPYLPSV